jgi:hypothetical protein
MIPDAYPTNSVFESPNVYSGRLLADGRAGAYFKSFRLRHWSPPDDAAALSELTTALDGGPLRQIGGTS